MAAHAADDLAAAIQILTESGDPAGARVAAALDRWRRSRRVTLEQAAGWSPNIRTASQVRQRDMAILRLAGRFSALSCRQLAEKVHAILATESRQHGDCRPDGIEGDIWDAVEHGAAALGCDRLRQILGAG